MRNPRSRFLIFLLLSSVFALAEGTRTWEQSRFEEFEKGTARGVAIRSDGALELAPALKPLSTTPSTYIWAIAADAQGNVYAAAGAPARVYRITTDGKTTVIFQPQELQVQALAVDPGGAVYAATSPDGKVYKIERRAAERAGSQAPATDNAQPARTPVDPNYSASVFFDPKTKYIWALAEDGAGRLYVATGDHGEIFRVEKSGASSRFFKSDEANIRCLALDAAGNLIAGSDGSGLIYRISPAGEGFVLYSAPKKEITALAIDPAGNIYASGVGEKRAEGAVPAPAMNVMLPMPVPTAPGAAAIPLPIIPFPGTGATGSEIYRIAPDGSPQRIWQSKDDVVYALNFDGGGRLLAGSGNKGKMFVINGPGEFTDLLRASATQITALAKAPGGGVYAATSNLGKVFLLGANPDTEGTYESDVFDGKIFSRWGRAEVRGHGAFDLYARSGNVDNPDRNWSPWQKVDFAKGGELGVPPARFVQWKAVLRPGNPAPVVDSVLINYLPKNVAPVVDDVVVQTGARFQTVIKPPVENVQVGGAPAPKFDTPTPAIRDHNSIAVRWTAHDDNDDDLVYSLYYRGDGETNWKLLKNDLTDKYYSFDASLLPDGGYVMRVVASDAPSHSPEDALSSVRDSARFEVDTTPPQVQNLNAAVDSNALHITFRAVDGFSPIKRAEFSVDAGDWQYVEPVGRLSDYRVENYDFTVPLPAVDSKSAAAPAGDPAVKTAATHEHIVVVRAYDRFDNVGTAKFVLHAP
jgi:sugar lactone lactonase YvrE